MVKTYKHLYPQICAFETLYAAFRQARKGGKRKKPEVAAFEYHLEPELLRLSDELRTRTYRPGPYHHFYIYERKKRKISAAPFRDRVVHHALCQVIEPLWETRFIHDSYACRVGKGTHRAADRAQAFARQYAYCLKCDIRQFFPSIDHAILKDMLGRIIADADVNWLIAQILHSGEGVLASEYTMQYFPSDDPSTLRSTQGRAGSGQGLWAALRPRGLPIGNLTSQFWANVYLNPLDHFVKRELKCPAYLRYSDDFLLFHDDKARLHRWREAVMAFTADLRLTLHANKSVIFPTRDGVEFVGYRIFPHYRRLRKDNVHAFARRLRRLRDAYHEGTMTLDEVSQSVQSWVAHAAHADTYRLRERLFAEVLF
jgi:retron-type reverse transcriptase